MLARRRRTQSERSKPFQGGLGAWAGHMASNIDAPPANRRHWRTWRAGSSGSRETVVELREECRSDTVSRSAFTLPLLKSWPTRSVELWVLEQGSRASSLPHLVKRQVKVQRCSVHSVRCGPERGPIHAGRF